MLFPRPFFARGLPWTGTPHTGGLTADMFYRSGELFAANLQRWASGQPPR